MRLQVSTGEVLFIKGPSGVGKTLLLRSLAALDPFDSGTLSLDGKSPRDLGNPAWRAAVTYVHQQRVALPGTPSDLYLKLQQLGAQLGRERGDLQAIAVDLGLEPEQINQPWRELSVRGEGCDGASVCVCEGKRGWHSRSSRLLAQFMPTLRTVPFAYNATDILHRPLPRMMAGRPSSTCISCHSIGPAAHSAAAGRAHQRTGRGVHAQVSWERGRNSRQIRRHEEVALCDEN